MTQFSRKNLAKLGFVCEYLKVGDLELRKCPILRTFIPIWIARFIIFEKLSHGRTRNRRCSVKKGFLEISLNSQKKRLCQRLFFNEVARLRPATLLKKRLWHRCFPVDFTKFLRTPFLQNTSRRLFLTWREVHAFT